MPRKYSSTFWKILLGNKHTNKKALFRKNIYSFYNPLSGRYDAVNASASTSVSNLKLPYQPIVTLTYANVYTNNSANPVRKKLSSENALRKQDESFTNSPQTLMQNPNQSTSPNNFGGQPRWTISKYKRNLNAGWETHLSYLSPGWACAARLHMQKLAEPTLASILSTQVIVHQSGSSWIDLVCGNVKRVQNKSMKW